MNLVRHFTYGTRLSTNHIRTLRMAIQEVIETTPMKASTGKSHNGHLQAEAAEFIPPCAFDFKSDTVTMPTSRMIAAASKALAANQIGDDVYREDKTTEAFQQKIAGMYRKEAALFIPSGTMANQICLRTHLHQPPHSIICDDRAHVYRNEAGALGMFTQAMVSPVKASNGVYLTLEDIEPNVIYGEDIHDAPTRVISLENTLRGSIMPLGEIKRISAFARKHDIRMHLDGARLWNAHVATGTPLGDYGDLFDSISVCLSKGLGAPIGSVIVGKSEYIRKATWFRKAMGGGMRQTGIIAAMADVCLTENLPQMVYTHSVTKDLARTLTNVGWKFTMPVDTNMIWLDTEQANVDVKLMVEDAASRGINIGGGRIVLHYQNSPGAIEELREVLKLAILGGLHNRKQDNGSSHKVAANGYGN